MSRITHFLSRLKKLSRLLRSPRYVQALSHGVGAAVEHEPMLRALACRTIVDVGANRGQFALAARQSLPDASIIAFEPLEEPARRFRRIFSSDPKVALHQTAIGSEPGEATIYLSKEDDSSSLLPLTSLQDTLFPGTAACGVRTVPVRRLEAVLSADAIEHPSLLKIDVQGYELSVIEGCGEMIASFDHICAEASFVELYAGQPIAHEIISRLERKGFRLRGILNPTVGKGSRVIQADFLFDRADGPKAFIGSTKGVRQQ